MKNLLIALSLVAIVSVSFAEEGKAPCNKNKAAACDKSKAACDKSKEVAKSDCKKACSKTASKTAAIKKDRR